MRGAAIIHARTMAGAQACCTKALGAPAWPADHPPTLMQRKVRDMGELRRSRVALRPARDRRERTVLAEHKHRTFGAGQHPAQQLIERRDCAGLGCAAREVSPAWVGASRIGPARPPGIGYALAVHRGVAPASYSVSGPRRAS